MRKKSEYVFSKKHDLAMDVYWPTEARDDRASVMSLHGGGFFEGSKDSEEQVEVAEALTAEGFIVMNADYRLGLREFLTPGSPPQIWELGRAFQQCANLAVEDCIDAINFVSANSEHLEVRPDRMVLTGCSAGAITVLQTEYRRVSGWANMLGGWQPAAVAAYSGAVVCRNREFYYRQDSAPTMLVHGLKDRVVSPRRKPISATESFFGSKRIKTELMKHRGGGCRAFWIRGAGHEVSTALPRTKKLFVEFVDQALDRKVKSIEAKLSLDIPVGDWKDKTIFDLVPNL